MNAGALAAPDVTLTLPREPLRHYCADGHAWTEQPDGGVSPSWGLGATSIKYPDWDPACCPEPERGHSRYENGGPDHGYKCPSCGTVHYHGGCLSGVRTDPWNTPDPECEPPPPVCGKPAVRTLRWETGGRGKAGGWIAVDAPGTQLDFGFAFAADQNTQRRTR